MALFEGKTPAERNKMIAGIVLPLIALVFVLRALFFSSGPAPSSANNTNRTQRQTAQRAALATQDAPGDEIVGAMRPIVFNPSVASDSGGGRNIFAFYERPAAPQGAQPPLIAEVPVATPTPPPPLSLASLTPQSVFARTGGFTMQVSGDKFTPETRLYIDGQEQPTQYRSPQQLIATVNAALITAPGARTIIARTPDNSLYSNTAVLNVMQPPAPTLVYVGLLKSARTDTAVLKESGPTGDLLSVRKGDLVERGRFRVGEITERNVELIDKELNIRHVLPFVESRSVGATSRGPVPGTIQPPPPPPQKTDEEGTAGEEEP